MSGQLGDGTTTNRTTTVAIENTADVNGLAINSTRTSTTYLLR